MTKLWTAAILPAKALGEYDHWHPDMLTRAIRPSTTPTNSVFREIQQDTKIVIEHVVKPWYRLTVTMTARSDQTHLAWVQEFESPEVAARMCPLSETANEQVLDRLQSRLASESS